MKNIFRQGLNCVGLCRTQRVYRRRPDHNDDRTQRLYIYVWRNRWYHSPRPAYCTMQSVVYIEALIWDLGLGTWDRGGGASRSYTTRRSPRSTTHRHQHQQQQQHQHRQPLKLTSMSYVYRAQWHHIRSQHETRVFEKAVDFSFWVLWESSTPQLSYNGFRISCFPANKYHTASSVVAPELLIFLTVRFLK